MNEASGEQDGASEGGPSGPAEKPKDDPSTIDPPIPKSPPTPLDLPDQDGLDLPRTG